MLSLHKTILPCVLFIFCCTSIPKKQLSKLPDALKTEYYTFPTSQNLNDRLIIAPKKLLDYIAEMDKRPQYRPYELNPKEAAIFSKYLGYLSTKLADCLRKNQVNFVFIENFTGGGMVQFTVAESGQISAFIVLNPKILTVPMQKWYEYRDNSPFFAGRGKIKLQVPLGNAHPALLGILIHEAAHAYDLFNNVTPYVDSDLLNLGLVEDKFTTFTQDIWSGFHDPVKEYDYSGRMEVRSYGFGNPIDSQYIPFFYDELGKTPFLTLYGARFWSEDYAETYTWCYLKQEISVEYSVSAFRGKEKIFDFYPLRDEYSNKRCASVL